MPTLASIRQVLPYAVLVTASVWLVNQLPEPWDYAGTGAIGLSIIFKSRGDPNETRHERKDRITIDVGLLIVLFSGLLAGKSFELAYSSGGGCQLSSLRWWHCSRDDPRIGCGNSCF